MMHGDILIQSPKNHDDIMYVLYVNPPWTDVNSDDIIRWYNNELAIFVEHGKSGWVRIMVSAGVGWIHERWVQKLKLSES